MHEVWSLALIIGLSVGLPRGQFVPSKPVTVLSVEKSTGILAVGSLDGSLILYDSSQPGSAELASYSTGSGVVTDIKWNPAYSNIVATVTSENAVVIRRFDDAAMSSTQTVTLEHTFPVRACDWDQLTGTKLLVGSARGFVDEYVVSFLGISGASHRHLSSSTDRTGRWFTDCEVSFVYRVSTTEIVAGCPSGKVTIFSTTQQAPLHTYQLAKSSSFPSPAALYRPANGYVIAYFDGHVFIVNGLSGVLDSSFAVRPVKGPQSLAPTHVLSFDLSFLVNNSPDKMAIRTTEGVAIFDLAVISAGSWINDQTLSDLVGLGAQISWSTLVQANPSNAPYVDIFSEYIDVAPCFPKDCTAGVPPAIAIEIVLPVAVSKIRGSFKIGSVGTVPATDCTAAKAPISQWTSNQQSQWTRVVATSPSVVDTCTAVPGDWKTISTVRDCKSSCRGSPECNSIMIYLPDAQPNFQLKDDRIVTSCEHFRCSDPSRPQTAATGNSEIWTLSRPSPTTQAFGGYVAFGTEEQVLHGGCAAADGVVRADTVVTVPETILSGDQSILRFQVSQYNANAVVRLKNLLFDMYLPYAEMTSFIPEPSGGPSPIAVGGTKIYTTSRQGGIVTSFDL